MFQRDNGILKPGQFSYREEVAAMLKAAGKADSVQVAEALLEYCAVGLDTSTNYTPSMVPWYIRELANEHLRASPAASGEWLAAVASGETTPGANKALHGSLRAAALRALGQAGVAKHRDALLKALADHDPTARLMACEALGASRDKDNLGALVSALEAEREPLVRQQLHLWIARLISSCQHKVDEALGRKAAEILGADMKLEVTWHYQAQLVEVMPVHNLPQYVPQLIDTLDRFDTRAEQLRSGRLSGALRQDTYRRLTAMTAAYYAIDDITGWRGFWEKSEAGFQVAEPTSDTYEAARKRWLLAQGEREEAKPDGEKPGIPPPKSTFFTIPVVGSNVRFVVDVGYATRLPMPITDPAFQARWKTGCKRIDAIKTEATRAISGLGAGTMFDVIAFSDRSKAAFKRPKAAQRSAIANARRFVDRLAPAKNYNLGSALALAFSVENLQYLKPAPLVDEVFIVSNHMSQFGAIKAPEDLVGLVADICRFSKVRIHTVYIGAVNDEDDKAELGIATMKRLAELTGGRFIRP